MSPLVQGDGRVLNPARGFKYRQRTSWLPDDMPSAEIDALRIAAENIPGVREVKMHMLFIPVIPGF